VSKTPKSLQKVHDENFPRKNRQKLRCQFPLAFFVLSRFRLFLSDGSKGGLRRKNTPEKQKKTATKPQGQERQGRLAFEEMAAVLSSASNRTDSIMKKRT
jgi:hypothetical protein